MNKSDFQAPAPSGSSSIASNLQVVQLWRYPVKSLLGERMSSLRLAHRRMTGDGCLTVAQAVGRE